MKTILFIDQTPGRRYISFRSSPLEPHMTKTRPSSFLMTAFVLVAAVLVSAAVSPILQIAASVVA
jgi:hypothetical protein